ncbi:DNA polymerase [Mycobacterium phage FF47]|uniref:DNA polymerase I n=2 Tax=Mapvirus Ff47 TaxID=1920751 RepID=A0A899IM53_9CAUD|nr:DNA polymerase [Mycobacterium phage FF47]AGI12312.1 DNA polymerase I [Mycobacterium phage FF47]QSL99578.1 DNA polymerase I [Mycobacterium phage Maco2]
MKIVILTKFVLRGSLREEMIRRVKSQGFRDDELVFMGCAPSQYDGEFSKADLKELRATFQENVLQHHADAILALGNEALFITTGHSGIMKWRGRAQDQVIPLHPDLLVMPTIALGAIDRNPSQIQLLYADIRALHTELYGSEDKQVKPSKVHIIKDEKSLEQFGVATKTAKAVAYDLETSGFNELEDGAFIVSAAFSLLDEDGTMSCWALPLSHPRSPCRSNWDSILRRATDACKRVPVRVAHNAKFDCRWLVQFGAPLPCNFDTMLAAHILDENRFKGLKPLAQMLLNAPAWDIDIKGGKNAEPWYMQHTLREILQYNALDTWHTLRLYRLFSSELRSDPRLERLFEKLIMPASQSLVHIERRGVYVHREKLDEGAKLVEEKLQEIHDGLMEYVPEGVTDVNFNPSNFLRWFLYDHLDLPVLKEGKTGPSVAETVLTQLAATNPHPAVDLLVERVKWQKFQSSFFNPYRELITDDSRLHTTFKLAGTVTGRLSSGKADSDKVTGSKASSVRGINLQQVPRDPLVRSIFGAPPGWSFVEADYSQIELRVAAEISGEPTLKQLYINGEDVHMAMAMRMTGKPASQVTKEERKKAKAVNFGFLYGMGWKKFIETAWNNYGLRVSPEEAQAARGAFFGQFPELLKWHARQRRLAHRNSRVQSPLGRIRHLPDIKSPESGVVAEAERQSINSPVQAFASDLCLLSLVLLDRRFRRDKLAASPIGTVHDAINFEVRNDHLPMVLPTIKRVMENPPLGPLFDFVPGIPIVADIKVGDSWGGADEIPGHLVHEPDALEAWLNERGLLDAA